MKRVLIVVPTYNEIANVKPLQEQIRRVFAGQRAYQTDILFVDDNSPDGTAEVIRSLQSTDPGVYLLSGSKDGIGKAYIRGFAYGLSLKAYSAVVTMDADLSHDPKDILRLLAALNKGADYVIGSRYIAGGHTTIAYSPFRRLQSAVANVMAKYFLDISLDIKDLTGGFKAIRVSALEAMPLHEISASGYVFQVNLLYEFAKRKYVIREVPITFHTRKHGKSKLGFHDVVEFLGLTFRLNPRARLPRIIRFGAVGASGTVVNVAVLVSLAHLFRLNVTMAYIIALEASIISNFALNHIFTFRFALKAVTDRSKQKGSRALINKLLRYNLVSLGGAGIALVLFTLTYRHFRLNYVMADLLGIIGAMSWNYWLSVKVVWRIIDSLHESEAFDH